MSADDLDPDAYYAYLQPSDDSALTTFGWRWFHDGELVVDYETDLATDAFFWLERFDRSEAGIFGAADSTGMGPGRYDVEFITNGNALFTESFTVSG
ncbi:MAG: hypothetical protein AAF467_19285 [Actinomycetota bacterium]